MWANVVKENCPNNLLKLSLWDFCREGGGGGGGLYDALRKSPWIQKER